MPEPAATPTARELYGSLGPWKRADGEETDWALLHLSEAVTRPLDAVEELIRDTDEGPGWHTIVDANKAPADFLPWLARFVGVLLQPALNEDARRVAIQDASGFKRGRPSAIAGAARTYLIPGGVVRVLERDESAYHLRVQIYAAQVPAGVDPAIIEAAVRAAVPGGLRVSFEVLTGLTWGAAAELFGTWGAMAAVGTWGAAISTIPEEP